MMREDAAGRSSVDEEALARNGVSEVEKIAAAGQVADDPPAASTSRWRRPPGTRVPAALC